MLCKKKPSALLPVGIKQVVMKAGLRRIEYSLRPGMLAPILRVASVLTKHS